MSEVGQVDRVATKVEADCVLNQRTFPVTVSEITCNGCLIEALGDELEPSDFLHLRIAGAMDVNGRTVWCKDRKAEIHFFGQIHPHAIDCLCRRKLAGVN
jgi:hypothetical protein